MKQIYFLTAILFLNCAALTAQTTDVITNVFQPTSLTLVNDQLYFGAFQGNLRKVDVVTGNGPDTVVTSNGIYRSFLYGNELYYTEVSAGTISKIDVTITNPTPTIVLASLNQPSGIFIDGNTLFFTEQGNNQVSKLDITVPNPTPTLISNQFNIPTSLALLNNDLYITEFLGNKISKIDITQTSASPVDFVTNLNNPTDIIVNGNALFVSEFSNNKVILIDMSSSTPVISDLVTNINQPTGLFLNGTDLYISVFADNKIVKFSATFLGLPNSENYNPKIKLFPNPSSNYIQIEGLTQKESFGIYNVLGAKIRNGVIVNDDKIDLQNFINGIYFLKFDNGSTLKFVKK